MADHHGASVIIVPGKLGQAGAIVVRKCNGKAVAMGRKHIAGLNTKGIARPGFRFTLSSYQTASAPFGHHRLVSANNRPVKTQYASWLFITLILDGLPGRQLLGPWAASAIGLRSFKNG